MDKENPDKKTLERWIQDPVNYKWGLFYFNPKDKRIFPPKKIDVGWAVNFANPYSIVVFIGILLAVLVLFFKYI